MVDRYTRTGTSRYVGLATKIKDLSNFSTYLQKYPQVDQAEFRELSVSAGSTSGVTANISSFKTGSKSVTWVQSRRIRIRNFPSIVCSKGLFSIYSRREHRVGHFFFEFFHMILRSDLPWTMHFWKNWSFCALKIWGFLHELLYKLKSTSCRSK